VRRVRPVYFLYIQISVVRAALIVSMLRSEKDVLMREIELRVIDTSFLVLGNAAGVA